VQEFFQWYSESNGSRPSADEENKMDLLKPGNARRSIFVTSGAPSYTHEQIYGTIEIYKTMKNMWRTLLRRGLNLVSD